MPNSPFFEHDDDDDCLLWADHISWYKPDLCLIYVMRCLIVITIICILLSTLILYCADYYFNDKFHIHCCGSLEYWMNGYEYEYKQTTYTY
jgi:hypothetical protein